MQKEIQDENWIQRAHLESSPGREEVWMYRMWKTNENDEVFEKAHENTPEASDAMWDLR